MDPLGENLFSATVQAQPGAIVDCVFWITKGALGKPADTWDLNAPLKDYHAIIAPGSIALIESSVRVTPTEPLSLFDFAKPAAILFLLLSAAIFLHSRWKKNHPEFSPFSFVLSCMVSLLIVLIAARATILDLSWDILTSPWSALPHLLAGSYYDIVFTCLLGGIFMGLMLLRRRSASWKVVMLVLFSVISLSSLILGVANMKIVAALGKPLNYQWLYYSDFLQTPDARHAIVANTNSQYLTQLAWLLAAAILMCCFFYKAFTVIRVNFIPARWSGIVLSATMIPLMIFGAPGTDTVKWKYEKLANPVVALVSSLDFFHDTPLLFSMPVADSLRYQPFKAKNRIRKEPLRNVILFVLESTPAEYVQPYGNQFNVTPQIARLAQNGISFSNVYAHAPATNLSMVSLLNSIYPWLSYNSLTKEHPGLEFPSLCSELKERGYRTGFFNSADNRYQDAEGYLGHRKFDVITDQRNNQCSAGSFQINNSEWEFMDGKNDRCTAEELNNWITSDTAQPFFAMIWTYQTHYPYFFKGREKEYTSSDTMLNRYLNALHHTDSIIGLVEEELVRNGLAESTLLVIVGDHGESFGRHGQITHGRMIYEENVHIPCLLINPGFTGSVHTGNGGLVDLAPTVMSLLGFDWPSVWEGEPLFAKTEDSPVFFFAPWSDHLFGYRTGDLKYIYNATLNTTEIYDLANDPLEEKNIAASMEDAIPVHHQRLAGWTQHVNRKTSSILDRKQKKEILARR